MILCRKPIVHLGEKKDNRVFGKGEKNKES